LHLFCRATCPLAIALSFCLTACGDDNHPTQPPPPGSGGTALPPDAGPPDAPPPDAPTLPQGSPCSFDGGLACGAGLLCCQTCCTPGAPVCKAPPSNDAGIGIHECPLPDLALDQDRLRAELGIGTATFSAQGCSVQEGCVAAAGMRRLLHFSVVTPNVGTADLYLGDPSRNPALFVYSACHMHYHFQGYALYRLLDQQGTEVLTGRKRAFCLEDFERQRNPPLGGPRNAQYDCSNQGISMGWADTYYNGLQCQFLDVTDVPPGTYTLEVTINPDHILPELRYDNNVGTVTFTLPAATTLQTDPCTGSVTGPSRECGWSSGGTFACTAGQSVRVGCGCGLGSCTGDTMIRICSGTGLCTALDALGQNDDCGGGSTCSLASFTCPASGQYTVLYGPYTTGDSATCTLAHSP